MIYHTLKFILNSKIVNKIRVLILGFFSVLSVTVSSVLVVLITKYVVNALDTSTEPKTLYIVIVSLLSVLFLTLLMESYFKSMFMLEVVKIRFKFLTDVGVSATEVEYEKTESKEYLATLNKAKNNSSNNSIGIAGFLITGHNILINLSKLISYSVILASLNIVLPFSIVLIVILTTVFNVKLGKLVYRQEIVIGEIYREKSYYIDSIYDYRTAKEYRLYSFDTLILDKINSTIERIFSKTKKNERSIFKYDVFKNIILLLFALSVIVICVNMLYFSEINLGEFTLYITSISLVATLINEFSKNYMLLKNRAVDVCLLEDVINDSQNSEEECGVDIDSVDKIEFVDVYFKYPNAIEYALENISLVLDNNNKYVIVGENGSGKKHL